MNLHAKIIEEDGKPKFALLPVSEYEALLSELSEFETLEDLSDYLTAIKVTEETKTWHSLGNTEAKLGID